MTKKRKIRWDRIIILISVLMLLFFGLIQLIGTGLDSISRNLYPKKYETIVEQYAIENEIDPLLIYAVIRTESGFDPKAVSNVDARGLMQITDETFQWIKSKIAPSENLAFEDLYDPQVNIRFGSYYFAKCMERYGNHVGTAAAAYHSGWGTVDKLLKNPKYSEDGKTLHTYPFEQMGLYVQKIDRAYTRYQTYYSNTENEV